MNVIQKWQRIRKIIEESRALDNPMIEPEAKITTEYMVAALLTIAEVIQEGQ